MMADHKREDGFENELMAIIEKYRARGVPLNTIGRIFDSVIERIYPDLADDEEDKKL